MKRVVQDRDTDARRYVNARTVLIPNETLDALDEPAKRRGVTAVALARKLVVQCVLDKMVDAVLDDLDPPARNSGSKATRSTI